MLMLSLRYTSYQLSVGYWGSYCSRTEPTECDRAIAEATFTFYLPKPRTSHTPGPRMLSPGAVIPSASVHALGWY